MTRILIENPLLLLFIVASVGYLIGSIRIKGNSLGVAAVLFVGLAFGAYNNNFDIPDIVFLLGLILFVYSIGISSGAAFFDSYRKNGFRDFLFISLMLVLSGAIAVALAFVFGFEASTITGVYAGSTTNTPALAGVIDYIQSINQGVEFNSLSKELVVGYSYSYPMGVLGGIIAIVLMEKWLKVDYKKELETLKKEYPVGTDLSSMSILVSNDQAIGKQLRDLYNQEKWQVTFGRVSQDEHISLTNFDHIFKKGDQILVVGSEEELKRVAAFLGERNENKLSYDRNLYDSRRIFVSNPRVAGRTISSLNLNEKYNTIITRIRRGDVDMLAKGTTVLELGDRIRFVARRTDLKALSKFFGDSYHQSSTVNLFSFGLGIGLGLVLGLIEISFLGINFKLGYAGGPLVVGLVLGALRRTGPIIWTLPYSANVTLRQIGLILLLAAVGVSSGNSFVASMGSQGVNIIIASAIISLLTAILTLWIGFKLVKIPFSLLLGIVSNQPAILDFAMNRSGSRIPMFGYTMMFPIALIAKIVIAQLLFVILS